MGVWVAGHYLSGLFFFFLGGGGGGGISMFIGSFKIIYVLGVGNDAISLVSVDLVSGSEDLFESSTPILMTMDHTELVSKISIANQYKEI